MNTYGHVHELGQTRRSVAVVVTMLLTLLLVGTLAGCSSSSSSSRQSSKQTVNGYSIAEYNADIDELAAILANAKSLNNQLKSMGDPNGFTSQQQVDKYNELVDQYNAAANSYNAKAKAFSSKYGSTIDGAGSKPTDPSQIDLPKKK